MEFSEALEFLQPFQNRGAALRLDSRNIQSGDVFLAIQGGSENGADYVSDALEKDAGAMILEHALPNKEILKNRPFLIWPKLKQNLAEIAAAYYKHPSHALKIVGITGTNGKTSTAYLLWKAWTHLGLKAAYIGTLGIKWGDQEIATPNTTPSSVDLQHNMAQFRSAGITHLTMECSAHGIAQGRLQEIAFDQVWFTNFSQDHLDDFKTLENYFLCKWSWTQSQVGQGPKKTLCGMHTSIEKWARKYAPKTKRDLNLAVDGSGRNTQSNPQLLTYGTKSSASFHIANAAEHSEGLSFDLCRPDKQRSLQILSKLRGDYNMENLAMVGSSLCLENVEPSNIESALAHISEIPGRLQRVPHSKNRQVYIDFAHSPEALSKALRAIKPSGSKAKLWCIFGCGGNRDRNKRPKMLASVQEHADHVVITADNPRSEAFEQIVSDMLQGQGSKKNIEIIASRPSAIKQTIAMMGADDVLLIAGKGHENTQTIGSEILQHSDLDCARQALENIEKT